MFNTLMIFSAIFTVQVVEQDYDKKYNILVIDSHKTRVSYKLSEAPSFKEGDRVYMSIKANCQRVYQLLEGGGKSGKWNTEDDWINAADAYLCNAFEVNGVKVAND